MASREDARSPAARVFAVVPAAGRSRRMGQAKLLLPWREATVIEQVLAAWQGSRVACVVVVVHPDDTELADVCRRAGAIVQVAATPPPDMKASVRLGLEWLDEHFAPTAADAWMLAPADVPELTSRQIDRVLAEFDPSAGEILVPVHAGRRGHPVLFPWPLAAEVPRLADDEGINALVKRHPVRELPNDDPGILTDLDTPEDYRRLQGEGRSEKT